MTTVLPKKTAPYVLAGICLSMALLLALLPFDSNVERFCVAAWFLLGGLLFVYCARRPTLQIVQGVLYVAGISISVSDVIGARLLRLWIDGGEARLLELRLLRKPPLPWYARVGELFSPLRWRFQQRMAGYIPPADPYLLLPIPETDLNDEQIVHLIESAKQP